MPKVSIIIPAYNVEDYIIECVESVVNQTLQDIEIIVVDDGSTDSTGRLLDEIAEKDDRIIIIHKENGGVTSARNTGLEYATGEFVGFVDGDDYIAENMYEELYKLAAETGVEVVSSQIFYMVYKDDVKIRKSIIKDGVYLREDNSIEYIYNNIWDNKAKTGIMGTIWCYMCKKDKFVEIQKKVPLDVKNAEDIMMIYSLMTTIDSICISNVPLYYYRMRDNSAIHSIHENYISYWNKVYVFVKEYFEKHYMADTLMRQLKYRVVYGILSLRFMDANLKRFFMFPYELVPPNSDIVIYGAGEVGKSYCKQIEENHFCNIVAWMDKNYKRFAESKFMVINPDEIMDMKYDFILIAVMDKDVADEITSDLVSRYCIDKEKILIYVPRTLIDFFDF